MNPPPVEAFMQRILLLGACAVSIFASVARAQICAGDPPFSAGNVQLNGQASSGNDAQAFGAGVAIGSSTAFGGISVGTVSYDDLDGSTLTLGAGVGTQVPLNANGSVQMCPVLTASLGFGPNDIEGTGTDASSRDFILGLTFGAQLAGSANFAMVPTAGVGVAYSSVKLEGPLFDIDQSDTYGILTLGAGLLFNSSLSIRPSVTIPFGVEEAEPVLGVNVAINLGGPRK